MKIRKQEYGCANIVGKNIERLRKERGIKQKELIAPECVGFTVVEWGGSHVSG